jgi:hypothetical protein
LLLSATATIDDRYNTEEGQRALHRSHSSWDLPLLAKFRRLQIQC